jgi:hypothetical protein
MHLIIFLHSKLKTSEDIDSLLSAELPDSDTQPELYHLVVKYIVHGPCGVQNLNAVRGHLSISLPSLSSPLLSFPLSYSPLFICTTPLSVPFLGTIL